MPVFSKNFFTEKNFQELTSNSSKSRSYYDSLSKFEKLSSKTNSNKELARFRKFSNSTIRNSDTEWCILIIWISDTSPNEFRWIKRPFRLAEESISKPGDMVVISIRPPYKTNRLDGELRGRILRCVSKRVHIIREERDSSFGSLLYVLISAWRSISRILEPLEILCSCCRSIVINGDLRRRSPAKCWSVPIWTANSNECKWTCRWSICLSVYLFDVRPPVRTVHRQKLSLVIENKGRNRRW